MPYIRSVFVWQTSPGRYPICRHRRYLAFKSHYLSGICCNQSISWAYIIDYSFIGSLPTDSLISPGDQV